MQKIKENEDIKAQKEYLNQEDEVNEGDPQDDYMKYGSGGWEIGGGD